MSSKQAQPSWAYAICRYAIVKDRLFLGLFAKVLKQNIPREVRAAETLNAVVFTDACYERNSVDWPCGIGGVFFFQQEACFFSLKVNAAAREALGE